MGDVFNCLLRFLTYLKLRGKRAMKEDTIWSKARYILFQFCGHGLNCVKSLIKGHGMPTFTSSKFLFFQIRECRELPSGQGLIIPCLIEHSENITSRPCQNFLNKMASIIFADYRFIYHFAEKCQSDITKFECGRLHNENDDVSWNCSFWLAVNLCKATCHDYLTFK